MESLDVVELPEAGSAEAAQLAELGLEALREGQVAFVLMAGGMATRMGGVVKALVEVALLHEDIKVPNQGLVIHKSKVLKGVRCHYKGVFPSLVLINSVYPDFSAAIVS